MQNAFVTAVTSSPFALSQAFNGTTQTVQRQAHSLKIGVEVPGLAGIVGAFDIRRIQNITAFQARTCRLNNDFASAAQAPEARGSIAVKFQTHQSHGWRNIGRSGRFQ